MKNRMLCGERLLLANMEVSIRILLLSLGIKGDFQVCEKILQSLWAIKTRIIMVLHLESVFLLGMEDTFVSDGMNGLMVWCLNQYFLEFLPYQSINSAKSMSLEVGIIMFGIGRSC